MWGYEREESLLCLFGGRNLYCACLGGGISIVLVWGEESEGCDHVCKRGGVTENGVSL